MVRHVKRAWRNGWRALVHEWHARPIATALACGIIFVGALAVFLGEGASRAFTIIFEGAPQFADVVPRFMGLLLFGGGGLCVYGIVKNQVLKETTGMVLIGSGLFIYGGGCIVGLGWNGAMSGGIALTVCVGVVGRVVLLGRDADAIEQRRAK